MVETTTCRTETTLPEAVVRATRYEVSCIPQGNANARSFTIHVKQCRDGQPIVTDGFLYLNPAGEWVDEPFGVTSRYDEETALALAKAAAPLMKTFHGWTVADALARAEASNA